MPRRRILAAAVALTAAAAAPFAYAAAGSHSRTGVSTLTLYSHATKTALVDTDGNKKPSPGDMAITTYVDYDHKGGTVLGSGTAVCVVVSLPSLLECNGSHALPGGRLFESCTSTKTLSCTVTGGTGAYRYVHGEAVAKQAGKDVFVTFSLDGA